MCGIAGIITAEKTRIDKHVLTHINKSLHHRGPDGHGLLFFDGEKTHTHQHIEAPFPSKVFFLHRRLSILDLSECGAQPMSTPDNRYHLTFNGEIYNFVELKEELVKKGYNFKSHSDTEVLLYMLIEYGEKALSRLRGMFAFAFLDTQKETVLLARDHFGIKPLFYTEKNGQIAFASELNALKPFLDERPKIHPKMTYKYLTTGLTDQNNTSLIDNVFMLPPRHYAYISLNDLKIKTHAFYQIKTNNVYKAQDLSYEEAARHVRELFLKSIELHMRSDVAVGAALSGGIDSSSIVSAVRYLYPNQEIHTFSYIAEKPLSEEKWVDTITKKMNTHSHKVFVKPGDILSDLEHLINLQGEPFGSTSIYAQNRVFKLAQEKGIKVTLDGQGADEFLGGYSCYFSQAFLTILKKRGLSKAYTYAQNAISNNPDLYLKNLIYFALHPKIKNHIDHLRRKKNFLNYKPFVKGIPVHEQSQLKDVLKEDMQSGFLHLLRYVDHNSMTASIESRVPFLMPELVEFILSLPENYIISDQGERKFIFKEAMRGIVPDEILNRKDKFGFVTPQKNWVQFLKQKAFTLTENLEQMDQTLFNVPKLKKFISGKPHEKTLWQIINFLIFAQNYNLNLNLDDRGGL